MSEYWKSTPRHYCPTCKIWLSGHPRNVTAHDQSEPHLVKKDIFLNQLAKKKRDDESKERDTLNTLKLIESAALNAMKDNASVSTVTQNDNQPLKPMGLDRYVIRKPTNSVLESVMRPIEERNIAKFIAEKLGTDTQSTDNPLDGNTSTVSDDMDYRKAELFYGDLNSIPIQLVQSSAFNNPACWTITEDTTTGLPLWTNKHLAISVWEEPLCLSDPTTANTYRTETKDEEIESEIKTEPMSKTPMKSDLRPHFIAAAGVPGAWEEVKPEESVLFTGSTGHEGLHKSRYEMEDDQRVCLENLSDVLDQTDSGGVDRAQRLVGAALDQHDFDLSDQKVQYTKPALTTTTASGPKKTLNFKKRPLLTKSDPVKTKRANSNTEDMMATEGTTDSAVPDSAVPSTDMSGTYEPVLTDKNSEYQSINASETVTDNELKDNASIKPLEEGANLGPLVTEHMVSEQQEEDKPRDRIRLAFNK